jgi:acetyl esterase
MSDPDYETLIDAATWAFIRETESWYPPETATFSIDEQRAVYNRMCRAFHNGYPDGVSAKDGLVAGVPVRTYECAAPLGTIVYFHGGGYVVGGLESHDDVCAEICANTACRVVSVDYRLCPEHPHPAGYDDSLAVTRAILATADGPVMLAGDSAGGNLAAAVSASLRGAEPAIAGQVLIYPGLGGDMDTGSYLTHAHAPMLTRDDLLFYARTRFAGGERPGNDPSANPLQASGFSGLPRTLAISAECDPLADDPREYCARINAAGGQAVWVNEPGLVHGYLRARHRVPRAGASFARICAALSAMARGTFPPNTGETP